MNRKIGFKKKLKREIAFEKENIRERERGLSVIKVK